MKIYFSPASPFVRKVMACASELGLSIERLPSAAGPVARDRTIVADNPLGQVPTFLADDGTVLYDSRVICEYLDTLHDGPRLFPAAGPARMTALRRQALGDGMLDTGLDWLVERARPEPGRSPAFIDAFRRKTTASLDMLEAEDLADGLGDIGLVALAVALGYLDFRFPDERWRDGRPHLAAWHERAAARPSLQATMPREG